MLAVGSLSTGDLSVFTGTNYSTQAIPILCIYDFCNFNLPLSGHSSPFCCRLVKLYRVICCRVMYKLYILMYWWQTSLVVFYIFISTSNLYVQQCGQLTGAAQCGVYKCNKKSTKCNWWYEMCMCLYGAKPTWRHSTASALTSCISILLWGEGHLHRGWICAPNLCHRRCAHLYIATPPLFTILGCET